MQQEQLRAAAGAAVCGLLIGGGELRVQKKVVCSSGKQACVLTGVGERPSASFFCLPMRGLWHLCRVWGAPRVHVSRSRNWQGGGLLLHLLSFLEVLKVITWCFNVWV